uniref:Uncharacterized protein n=1 Tax=Globisporangium ultimum (strain ATCC 200006 / CBS 805.95 / DAOM BR144) TaxID=431595 RepID=K3WRE6_GLOUD
MSSKPQSSVAYASLPRRLTFTTETAEQQYQSAMKSVQEYLRLHIPAHQMDLLGVNDARSRYYFEEIQQYLAHRVKREQLMQRQQQQPQQELRADSKRIQRKDSELLDDLDEFLSELDPALFADPVHDHLPINSEKAHVSQLKRSCSYIKQMQEDAFMKRHKMAIN